jgi:ATP-dependent Clp protease ATP-binding subunit ClpC
VQDYDRIKKALLAEAEKFFRPEFINRLDEIIVFRPLVKDDLVQIIDIELAKVRERLAERHMSLVLDQAAKDFLIEKGYNPDFGARPLRRAIGSYIEDPLAESLLTGEFKPGDTLKGTRPEGKEHLAFVVERPPVETVPPQESTAPAEPASP